MTYHYRFLLLTTIILVWLLAGHSTTLANQANSFDNTIPQITFNDQVRANIVRMYAQESKAKAIRIYIKLTPAGYECNLLAAYFYENIANYAPEVVRFSRTVR